MNQGKDKRTEADKRYCQRHSPNSSENAVEFVSKERVGNKLVQYTPESAVPRDCMCEKLIHLCCAEGQT